MRILVNGKNSQLGQSINKLINVETKMDIKLNLNRFIFVGKGELDLSSQSNINHYFDNNDKFDIIITYRKKRAHSTSRIIISLVYNFILRLLFKTKFRDISTGQRLLKKTLITKINLKSNSPFFGAELAIKSFYNKYKIKEIGVIEYPTRILGGSSVTFRNIILTILEMISLYYSLNLKKKK